MKASQKAGVMELVKRMISKRIENKSIGWDIESNTMHNGPISATDCQPLIQQIYPDGDTTAGHGDSSQQRIGDKINPKSLSVKGILSFNQADLPDQRPIYVRVLILAQKDIKLGASVNGNVATSVLLHPAGLSQDEGPYSGYTRNILYPINRNKFRVYYDKTFMLCSGALSNNGKSVEQLPNWVKRWSYTFKSKNLPTALTYDAASDNWANNFAPFLAIGYSYGDGSQPDTDNAKVLSTCHTQLYYEDA